MAAAIAATELTFVAVGTPASGGKIDLKYVEAAASEIGVALRHKANYHTEEHGDTRHDCARELMGKDSGPRIRIGHESRVSHRGTAVADFWSFSKPDSCEIPPPRDQNNDLRVGNRLTQRADQIPADLIVVYVRARDRIMAVRSGRTAWRDAHPRLRGRPTHRHAHTRARHRWAGVGSSERCLRRLAWMLVFSSAQST